MNVQSKQLKKGYYNANKPQGFCKID